ncbi:hypothetical protein D3C72_2202390 [compost metagenome]
MVSKDCSVQARHLIATEYLMIITTVLPLLYKNLDDGDWDSVLGLYYRWVEERGHIGKWMRSTSVDDGPDGSTPYTCRIAYSLQTHDKNCFDALGAIRL